MRIIGAACLFLLISGCGALPHVVVEYRLPKATSKITVTETYACNPEKSDYVVVSDAVISTEIRADQDAQAKKAIRLKDIDGFWSNSTIGFTLSEDGRLKGINSAQTGVGGEVVKQVAAILTGVRASVLVPHPVCAIIDEFNDSKPLSLRREAKIDHNSPADSLSFVTDASGTQLYRILKSSGHEPEKIFTVLAANFKNRTVIEPIVQSERVPDTHKIYLRKLRTDIFTVKSSKQGDAYASAPTEIELGATVPDRETYFIPLPKATMFGENTINLTLSDFGAVTALSYSEKSGAPAALEAISSANAYANPSNLVLAAEAKARADILAQQQRLAVCLADPGNCKP